jgi:hypothetical protein
MSKSRARRFADIISGAEDIPVEALGNVPPNTALVDNADNTVLDTSQGLVGIGTGTTTPSTHLDLKFNNSSTTSPEGLFINNTSNIDGSNASLMFSNDSGGRKKASVSYVDEGSYGTGSLRFYTDADFTSGTLDTSTDERMRIRADGVSITGDLTVDSKKVVNDGYPVVTTSTTAPASPVDGQFWWDNSTGNVKIYDSTQSGWFLIKSGLDGSSASRAIPSIEEATQYLGPNFPKGAYWINTPDGGVQQAYLMYLEDKVWVLVGRWQNDASSSITNTMSSHRSMIQVDQTTTARYSADWGTQKIDEIMFWGATDFEAETGHTINWVYDVSQRPDLTFRSWSVGGTAGDNSSNAQTQLAVHNQKDGHYVDGARDGYFKGSRWVNTNYKYHRMSDSSTGTCWVNPYGLSNPVGSVAYYHGMADAKFSVSGNGSDTSGQDSDGTTSQLFGYDDNYRAFYDAGTGTVNNNSTRRDFSSAVTMWISPRV